MRKVKIEINWDEMNTLSQAITQLFMVSIPPRDMIHKLVLAELVLLDIRFRKKLIFRKPGTFKISLTAPEACALFAATQMIDEMPPDSYLGNLLNRLCLVIDQTLAS